MTVDAEIRDEKLQYDNRKAAKTTTEKLQKNQLYRLEKSIHMNILRQRKTTF